MRKFLMLTTCLSASFGWSQGAFTFYNPRAPTRIGSPGGPLAGPGFWGQALVGLTATNLALSGIPREHNSSGLVARQSIFVPYPAEPGVSVQVQMVAWDGALWGADFASVPPDQLGFTDIVPVLLVDPDAPNYFFPIFTQPAIVPIPEPTAVALTFACVIALACRPRLGRRKLPSERGSASCQVSADQFRGPP